MKKSKCPKEKAREKIYLKFQNFLATIFSFITNKLLDTGKHDFLIVAVMALKSMVEDPFIYQVTKKNFSEMAYLGVGMFRP